MSDENLSSYTSIFTIFINFNFLIKSLNLTVLAFSSPFKLRGRPKTKPPTLYSSISSNNISKSLLMPFLLMVLMGVAIVSDLSLTAIPIVLSPKSRPKSVSDVLSFSINSLGLLTKVYKLKIDKNTTLKIAKLSRIKIADDEVDELSSQLSAIVDWVEQLNEVNTDNIEPLTNISSDKLPLRKDIANTEDNSKEVLSNAPDKLENYFAVPKVVE